MTKQKKLTKVIERAVKRGYDFGSESSKYTGIGHSTPEYVIANSSTEALKAILFSHDFAKAYWPKGKVELLTGKYNKDGPTTAFTPFWQFHLKNAVLAKDPIDYYYKNK